MATADLGHLRAELSESPLKKAGVAAQGAGGSAVQAEATALVPQPSDSRRQ